MMKPAGIPSGTQSQSERTLRVLRRVWEVLEDAAPYEADCGDACSRRCCGGDEHAGMLLFPEERQLMERSGGCFTFSYNEDGEEYAVCSGRCSRQSRPIACRIYPLFPLPQCREGQTRIRLILDPRARAVCPIAAANQKVSFGFRRKVRRAARLLLTEPVLRDAYLKMAQPVHYLWEFQQKLGVSSRRR